MIVRVLCSLLILCGSLWGAGFAAAQSDYPARAVTLQVPWPAGGSTDIGARIVAAIAEKKLGQPMVVTNRGGAGSQIGLTETARSKPDGYTMGLGSFPAMNTIVLDPERKAAFTLDSFVYIINQVIDPGIIWAKGDSPYKTLKDLLDDARKRPGEVRACTTGIMGDDHIALLMLEKAANVKFRIVHLDGSAPVFAAVLGGQVDVAFGNVGDIGLKIKGTPLRVLMVMDTQRSKFLPDVPNSAEVGFPDIISASTRGIYGPAGIPSPIVKKLQTVFLESMNNPDHMDKMDKAALAVKPLVGEEFKKYVYDMHQRITPLMDAARQSK